MFGWSEGERRGGGCERHLIFSIFLSCFLVLAFMGITMKKNLCASKDRSLKHFLTNRAGVEQKKVARTFSGRREIF